MRLRQQSVTVTAPRELVYEVVAAAGRTVGNLEYGRLVEFETSWRGETIKTFEAVTLDPPRRIGYRWVVGPLDGVSEEILFEEGADHTTEMMYRGCFGTPDGLLGWFRGALVVRPIFNKLVTEHLAEAKLMAESRASRTNIYKHEGGHESDFA